MSSSLEIEFIADHEQQPRDNPWYVGLLGLGLTMKEWRRDDQGLDFVTTQKWIGPDQEVSTAAGLLHDWLQTQPENFRSRVCIKYNYVSRWVGVPVYMHNGVDLSLGRDSVDASGWDVSGT